VDEANPIAEIFLPLCLCRMSRSRAPAAEPEPPCVPDKLKQAGRIESASYLVCAFDGPESLCKVADVLGSQVPLPRVTSQCPY
jgi:hypothetical protein